jgi:hypothetical protein
MIFGKKWVGTYSYNKKFSFVQLLCDKKNFLINFLKNILGYVTAYDKGLVIND